MAEKRNLKDSVNLLITDKIVRSFIINTDLIISIAKIADFICRNFKTVLFQKAMNYIYRLW